VTVHPHQTLYLFFVSGLPQLHTLTKQDKIFGFDIAGLTDRILVSEGKRQEFGTQFKQVDGNGHDAGERPKKHLERRRAKYLLPPMPVYRQLISDYQRYVHLPAELPPPRSLSPVCTTCLSHVYPLALLWDTFSRVARIARGPLDGT
jgi:hypothetical protein